MKLPPTLRSLFRQPGFCAVVILTLGLGIGVNTAMYSIVDTLLFRGIPLTDPERVLALSYLRPGGTDEERISVSQAEFVEMRAAQKSFLDLAVFESRTTAIVAPGRDPERIDCVVLSASALTMLPVPLAFGRGFTAAEEGPEAPSTVVLSDGFWRRQCGADPGILGKVVRLDGESATVIGVAAPRFRFPEMADAWRPPRGLHLADKREVRPFVLFGRVKPGVDPAAARVELVALARRQVQDHPEGGKDLIPRVTTLSLSTVGTTDRAILGAMLAAVTLVLLVACANVANLLLARAAVRERELMLRSALGAGRWSLVGTLLADAVILGVGGAALGLGIAWLGLRLFDQAAASLTLSYWQVFALDGRAFIYALGMSGVACLLAGLYPAWRLSRPDLNGVLTDASRGSSGQRLGRFTGTLLVAEIALSCVLLVLAALNIRTVIKIQTLPLGFTSAGVYTGRVALPESRYATAEKHREFHRELLERLRAQPEVGGAALCDLEATWDNQERVAIEGRNPTPPNERGPMMCPLTVSSGYFEVLGIALLAGRDFRETDTAANEKVAVVSQAFAERHWPGESALGKRLKLDSAGEHPWRTVVGIVPARMQGRFSPLSAPQVYFSAQQGQADDVQRMSVLLRTRGGEAGTLAPILRSTVRSLDEELPVYFAQTLDEALAKSYYNRQLIAVLFAIFGVVAAVLAAVGLFGVTSYGITQRTLEIGIRMALGATPRRVLGMVLRESGVRLALGLALGLTLAILGGGILKSVLYGVSATDPVSFGGTILLLALAAFVATLLPGLRAVRLQPSVALRAD